MLKTKAYVIFPTITGLYLDCLLRQYRDNWQMNYMHRTEFKVRDYECDMQGIVNNGTYQNYLEHARHEFLKTRNINFAEVTASGINLVVIRVELDYRDSLKSNDAFEVCSNVNRISRLRFGFQQDIYRLADYRLMLQGKIIATSLNQQGKPFIPELLVQLFD